MEPGITNFNFSKQKTKQQEIKQTENIDPSGLKAESSNGNAQARALERDFWSEGLPSISRHDKF